MAPIAKFKVSNPEIIKRYEEVIHRSADHRALVAVQFLCYSMLIMLSCQIVAAINQKRYRISFYSSFAGLAMAILIFLIKFAFDSGNEAFFDRNNSDETGISDSAFVWGQNASTFALIII